MKNIRLFNVALLLIGVLCVPDSRAQDYTRLSLPEGAIARLGKGRINGTMTYSPDGTRLAVASNIGIWIYDAYTFAEVDLLLTGHTGAVTAVAFSPDGTTLASGGDWQDATIRLWKMDDGQAQVAILEGHTDEITSVAFSPDETTLASGSEDRTVRLWDVSTGQLRTTLKGHTADIRSVAFSPDSRTLASLSQDRTVRLWEVDTGRLKTSFTEVTAVAFLPDGSTLASGYSDGKIRLWEVDTGQLKTTLKGHPSVVTAVTFLPDGSTLASGYFDGKIRLWEVDTGQLKTTLIETEHQWGVGFMEFSPDGFTLASRDAYRTDIIRLWDVDTGQLKATLDHGHTDNISEVAFAPDGGTLASGSWDTGSSGGAILLWDVDSDQIKTILTKRLGGVSSVAFAPDGHTLASGGSNTGPILLWDVDSGQIKTTLVRYSYNTVLAFSPDGSTLASGSTNFFGGDFGSILLWDVNTGQIKTYQEEELQQEITSVELLPNGSAPKRTSFPLPVLVTSLAFSPDGSTLASGHTSGTIRLQDVGTGRIHTILKNPDHLSSVAFSPDGKTLAIWGGMMIQLWDADSDQLHTTFKSPYYVSSVAFSPDGKTLASGSYDMTVRLWDVGSGQLHTTLKGHTHYVSSVAFSPDGKTLASGSRDATILLWDVSPYITPIVSTAIQSSPPLPTQTALLANFPNPFNPDTYIPYQLHAPTQVRLSIYDVRGALVREIDLGYRVAGQYLTIAKAARWDGCDQRGQLVSSGVYLYRLQAGPVAHVRKMVLVK